jgi:hypothetical protein
MKRRRGLSEDATDVGRLEQHHNAASRDHQLHRSPAETSPKPLHPPDRPVVGLNPFEKADHGPTTRDDTRGDRSPGQIGKRQQRGTSSEPGIGHSASSSVSLNQGVYPRLTAANAQRQRADPHPRSYRTTPAPSAAHMGQLRSVSRGPLPATTIHHNSPVLSRADQPPKLFLHKTNGLIRRFAGC